MSARLRIPAEWERHEACWLAFPYRSDEWPLNLHAAQRSIASLSRSIAEMGKEPVRLLVQNAELEARARGLVGDVPNVDFVRADYGDCWLRDTAPLLGRDDAGALSGIRFEFNGWGSKYEIPLDEDVGPWLLDRLGAREVRPSLTLEGGALESNGRGTILTTVSCALNPNRNPSATRASFERALSEVVVLDRLVWLEKGLAYDHTDGHVDMVARFASPQTVLCMSPRRDYPNAEVLGAIAHDLRSAGLDVVELPAPPPLTAPDGTPLPATYCNFYVANEAVIVPTYGVAEDRAALETIADAFPGREAIGLEAFDLLCGGGAFHCVTQPQPARS